MHKVNAVTNFQLLVTACKESITSLILVFRKRWQLLTLLFLLFSAWEQIFLSIEVQAQTDQNQLIIGVAGQGIGALIGFFLLIHIVPGWLHHQQLKIEQPPLRQLLLEHSIPLVTENLRAMLKITLWLFALIIPGVLRWIEYTLVSLVVVLDPRYKSGTLNPLHTSKEIIFGIRWTLFLFLVIDTGLYFAFDAAKHRWLFLDSPAEALLTALIAFVAYLWSYTFIYSIYRQRTEHI